MIGNIIIARTNQIKDATCHLDDKTNPTKGRIEIKVINEI